MFQPLLVLATAALVAVTVVASASSAATQKRVLVALENVDASSTYSILVKSLEDRGYSVSVQSAKEAQIFRFGAREYEHVLLMSPDVTKHKAFQGESLVEFLGKGGNLLMTANSEYSSGFAAVVKEFGIVLPSKATSAIVSDKFSRGKDATLLSTSPSKANLPAIFSSSQSPVLFRGVGHALDSQNTLVYPVLFGTPTSTPASIASGIALGADLPLASALQARNQARFVFIGSTEVFSKTFMEDSKNGNAAFAKDITQWVLREKSMLSVKRVMHHKKGEASKKNLYRIKDDFVYEIDLEETKADGKRVPFQLPPGDKLQLELVMLHPYERVNLLPSNSTKGRFTTPPHFRLPDKVGVFTLKVHYQRFGYSIIDQKETVSIVPFRHNEFPHIVQGAYPYYASAWSMMVGFWLVVAVFLFYREPVAAVPGEKKDN